MSAPGTMPPPTTGMSTPRARTRSTTSGTRVRWAPEHREPDRVDVLVDGRGGDGVGGLEQPGVDHLVACVAQDAGDFDPAVVTVEADLGDEDPLSHQSRLANQRAYQSAHQMVGTSTWRPNTSPIVAISSPSVA